MASQHLCPCCSLCEDQPPVSGFDLCRSCLNGIEGKSQTEPPTSVTSVLGSILESDQVPDSVASDLSHLSTVLASSAPSASSDWKSPFNRPYKDVFVSSLSRSSPFAPPIVSRSTDPAAVGSEREARRAAAVLEPSSSSALSFHSTASFSVASVFGAPPTPAPSFTHSLPPPSSSGFRVQCTPAQAWPRSTSALSHTHGVSTRAASHAPSIAERAREARAKRNSDGIESAIPSGSVRPPSIEVTDKLSLTMSQLMELVKVAVGSASSSSSDLRELPAFADEGVLRAQGSDCSALPPLRVGLPLRELHAGVSSQHVDCWGAELERIAHYLSSCLLSMCSPLQSTGCV